MKRLMMAAVMACAAGTMAHGASVTPFTYEDPKYLRDWWAPAPDWVPKGGIQDYNQNTRVPEVTWAEYKGSWGPALCISLISDRWLDRLLGENLIRYGAKSVPFAADREKNALWRTVRVDDVKLPPGVAATFTNLSFRVRKDVAGAGANIKVWTQGAGTYETAACKDVRTEGDVTTYSFPVANGRDFTQMEITLDPITEPYEKARQEITIFDLHFKCSKQYTPFKSPAPRAFIDREGREVEPWSAITNAAAEDVKEIPVRGWKPEARNGEGLVVETVQEKVGGETLDCLRMTWTRSEGKPTTAIATLPFEVNALEWNTYAFLYKVEVVATGSYERCENRVLNKIPQYFMFNKYVDNPGVSFASRHDCINWNRYGVTRSYISEGRRPTAQTPAGWKAFVFDMVHDDPVGNKWFTLDKITSMEFTFKNKMLAPGDKVIFTVARPRLVRGLMYRGGDMKLWEEFKTWKANHKVLSYKEALKENRFDAGRLDKPVPIMRDRIIDAEIVNAGSTKNRVGRDYTIKLLQEELTRALNPINEIPVVGKATTNDNVKFFLGLPGDAPEAVREFVAGARKAHEGTAVTIIANDGKKFYFAGSPGYPTVDEGKGIINGVLDFLEANFGLMWPRPVMQRGIGNPDPMLVEALRPYRAGNNADLTWGRNWVVESAIKYWGLSDGNEYYSYRNRASYFGCWYGPAAFEFSSYRAYAANHWFGFGGGREENEKWGLSKDGKRLRPGCYTSTPCLIKVIEDGKDDFAAGKITKCMEHLPNTQYYKRYNDDCSPCWIEDTWNTCQCAECLKPFRLPDGTLITKEDPDFHAEAHFVNANAYLQAVRTYLNRDSELNYLIYFYTIPVPRTPVSGYVRSHFCPYVRVNYDIPIYAPVNDKFWRVISQWCQVARSMGVSEYFLGGNFRPSADVQAFDLAAYREIGVSFFGQETETQNGSFPEMWVAKRKIYMPDWNADSIRAYYCRNVFGAGAELMYDFYAKLRALRYTEFRDMEFEETGCSELGRLALETPSNARGCKNLGQELDMLINKAYEKTRGDEPAHFFVGRALVFWNWYYANAQKEWQD